MSIASRWRNLLKGRQPLVRTAQTDYTKDQAALAAARTADLHPRQRLVDAVAADAKRLTLRRAQVAAAERVIARHPDRVTTISEAGVEFIAEKEGVTRWAYNDSRGFATAWVGHLIAQRPVNDADRRTWGTPQHPAPLSKVLAYFRTDLRAYDLAVAQVWAAAPKGPTQNQYDSCVSLAFNVGAGGFTSSTVARLIRTGAPAIRVADAFLLWNKPPEILGRRKSERALYLKP